MHPRHDRRLRDYEAEAACPNYLIESFRDVEIPNPFKSTRSAERKRDQVSYSIGKLAGSRTAWRRQHDAQIAESIHRFFHPQPKWVDGEVVRREGERQAKWTAPFIHSKVSKAARTSYETKLFKGVAAYRQRDHKLIEEARQLKKAADLYWQFCVAFEFPQVCDQEVMEKAAEHVDPIVRKITVQAREAYRGGLEDIGTGEVAWLDVPAQSAGLVTKTINKRIHLGSRRNLQILITAINERATVKSILKSFSDEETGGCPINAVLIMEPNLDEGDLNYLPEFRAACPGVDVYIFHRWDEAKYGVEVTGDVDNWENEFPSLSECEFEPPQVIVDDLLIKGNIHVAAGRFEAFKTMALIELVSAILDQRPAFDHFTVHQRYPVLFLCADMSPELFDQYSSPFKLRKLCSGEPPSMVAALAEISFKHSPRGVSPSLELRVVRTVQRLNGLLQFF
jgi:hypothetical protein